MDGQRTHGTYVACAMTRRRNVQLALAQVVLTTALGKPEDLMDPILRFIDALLDDEELVVAS